MQRFTSAAVSPRDHGTPARAFGEYIIRMRAADTGAAFGMFEAIVPPAAAHRTATSKLKPMHRERLSLCIRQNAWR